MAADKSGVDLKLKLATFYVRLTTYTSTRTLCRVLTNLRMSWDDITGT